MNKSYCRLISHTMLVGILFVHSSSSCTLFDRIASLYTHLTSLVAKEKTLPSPAFTPSTQYTLSGRQAENYVDNYLASLDFSLRPDITNTDIASIKTMVASKLKADNALYIWVHGVRMYNKDAIDRHILNSILDYVENNSYTLAYNQTLHVTISQRVARTLRSQAAAYVLNQQYLDFEQLRPFFGAGLAQLVRQHINHIDMPYQPHYNHPAPNNTPSATVYSSVSCCICMEPFSSTVKRIYLKPCGHDICEVCALNWFFPHNTPDKTRTCPHCRSNVNFDTLFNDLEL